MLEVEAFNEITDLNVAYVLLAQKLLRQDRAAAMLRLGLDARSADFVQGLSALQVMKLATTSFLLCSLRLSHLMDAVVKPDRKAAIQQAHLSIVLAGRHHARELAA